MKTLCSYLSSSVGRKQIMGLTGLGLCGFVLGHMAGNLLLFVGPEAYNLYGHTIISSPLLYVAEAGLIVLFGVHVVLAIGLSRENKKARPVGYQVGVHGEQAAPAPAKFMAHTGIIIFIFAIYHLITFKYGPHYTIVHSGVEMRDLYRLVVEVFESPFYVGWYLVSMVLLWFHLSHGFASSFQSLGINRPISRQTYMKMGYVFATIVAGGFFLQPLFAWSVGKGA
jgi:succinate dehydrogenase / fumarate reductase cytochrome b subunit